MSVLATVADIAIVIAAIPALIGAIVWIRTQLERRKERRAAREVRSWNGYVSVAGDDTWFAKVVEDPDNKWTERVILEVLDPDGTPNASMAHGMRIRVNGDGMLSRCPTPDQWDFLKDLQNDRFNGGQGYPIQ